MIGVAIVQYIRQNNFRLIFPDSMNKLALMGFVIFKKTISHFQVFTYMHTHNCGRIRGFIRRPTPEQVTTIAAQEHLTLTPAEATAYAEVLDGTFAAIDRLDELAAPLPPRG